MKTQTKSRSQSSTYLAEEKTSTFKVVLLKRMSFLDFANKKHLVKAGTVLDAYQTKDRNFGMTAEGEIFEEAAGRFLAILPNGWRLALKPHQFRAFN